MAKNKTNLITALAADSDILNSSFSSDADRIKYITHAYANMDIAKAFETYYNMHIDKDVLKNHSINTITNIELGQTYLGEVKEITDRYIYFDIPGCKDEIVCKENFSDCMTNVQSYLAQHDNKLLFEVREHKPGRYVVSIIEAYYKKWQKEINECIKYENPIQVHIDTLVRGGYICHTHITTLYELTGRLYTHSVFIPGSNIVLNIEYDFEKWVGQDVPIIPQNFVEYRRNRVTGEVENSIVGSRKRVLQLIGENNLADIYAKQQLLNNTKSNQVMTFDGKVTGIINSSKKTGVFVELNDKYITGLMPVKSDELLDYQVGDNIKVCITEFEVQDGKEPFVWNKNGKLVKCNCRPVFGKA